MRGHESAFVSWLSAHDYSDLFLLIKGVSGTSSFDVLSATMAARVASKRPLRVWAWLVGFHDQSHDPSWRYVVGDWVAPDDPKYVAHLTDLVRSAIDPARGHVAEPPDGVMLDDSFEWPGPSYGGTTAAKVQSLMAAIDAIRAEVSAVAQSAKKNVLLGFAPLPETGVVSKTSTSITTAAAASYGQDFGEIAKRCDWIVPETYRYGFYPEQAPWIAQVVADIRKEVTLECGARAAAISVAPVLVLYESDANPTAISSTDLGADLGYAKKAGGYSVFRYTSHTANPGAGADGRDQPTAAQITVLDQP